MLGKYLQYNIYLKQPNNKTKYYLDVFKINKYFKINCIELKQNKLIKTAERVYTRFYSFVSFSVSVHFVGFQRIYFFSTFFFVTRLHDQRTQKKILPAVDQVN